MIKTLVLRSRLRVGASVCNIDAHVISVVSLCLKNNAVTNLNFSQVTKSGCSRRCCCNNVCLHHVFQTRPVERIVFQISDTATKYLFRVYASGIEFGWHTLLLMQVWVYRSTLPRSPRSLLLFVGNAMLTHFVSVAL